MRKPTGCCWYEGYQFVPDSLLDLNSGEHEATQEMVDWFRYTKPIILDKGAKMKRYWLVAYDGINHDGSQHVGNIDCWTEGPGNWTVNTVRETEEKMKREFNLKMARITNIMPLDPPRET